MVAKLGVLVFLLACHTSSPSVSGGSGSTDTVAATPAVVRDTPGEPQKDAPANNGPGAVTSPALPASPTGAGSPPPTRPTQPTPPARPTNPPSSEAPEPPAQVPAGGKTGGAAPGIGETCGAGDACATGLECVAYYGFAGTRGPRFTSCEVRCVKDGQCPKGRHCVTISDGPGSVCR
jgi:hypothetical protein